MPKPIKRHIALRPVSREHHHGLLLSWKIRQGLKQKVELKRIKKYTDWFWENHLQQHFEFEEEYMFPILGKGDKLIKRALREHARLKRLFNTPGRLEVNLSLLEEELVSHIRFEERELFEKIEKAATEEQLARIEKEHSHSVAKAGEWQDEFWE